MSGVLSVSVAGMLWFLSMKALVWISVSLLTTVALGQQPVIAPHAMVTSATKEASEAGVEVLKKGGNAVDAACAVGLALAVTFPEAGNLGGGGFMLIRLANGRTTSIDYREAAPDLASETMYQDPQGQVMPNESLVGYKASGVPGTVAGLALAQRKYGKLKWADVVAPALRVASDGFTVSEPMARSMRAKRLSQFPESYRIFQRSGNFYKAGETFRQPELASTLKRLQAKGPDDFYRGETAKLIAKEMQGKGLIGLKDLAEYKPAARKPITGSYRGYQIVTMPPPSSGGIALIEMLNMLGHFDLAADGFDTVQTDHLLVETMRRAFADRAEFLGDPDFVKVPVKGLTNAAYAAGLAQTIDPDKADVSSKIGHGDPAPYESAETTHFSVVDADGNAVSNTYTLNFGFGSGVTVAGAGFLMNDEMDDFTSKVGVPNGFGLIQGAANAIQPHKRPLSSMTPTVVLKDGKLFMVVGSPGGPTIITTVLQVISNVIDHGMNVSQAVAAARVHHQWLPDRVDAEEGAVPEAVSLTLKAMGYTLNRGGHWGDAESILVDAQGNREGATDPRSSRAAAIGY